MSETLQTNHEGRYVLRIERHLDHAPGKVWRALTEPVHLNQWFPFDVELDLSIDGKMRFVEKAGDGPTLSGVVTELEPTRVFGFNWEGDGFRLELCAEGAGCLLIFSHTFDDKAAAASFTSGWCVCLDGLQLVLDGKPVELPRPSATQHEAFVDAFGLGAGSVETGPEGWTVRFERQLTQVTDEVWRMLAAAEASGVTAGATPPSGFTTGDVVAGPITAVEAPTMLEYEWCLDDRTAGCVRWELGQGTGHGARLVLTQTGPPELDSQQAVALQAWEERIDTLAKDVARRA